MEEILGYRVKLLERLKDQPSELQGMINAIPESEWKLRQDATGRTIHQIVAHIRDVEVLAFLPRFRLFLTEPNPFFEPFSSHTWSAADYQAAEPMTKMLADFSQARAEVWELMRPLTPEDWSRLAFHPPSGRRTAQWWAERIYVHAQDHLKEIRRAASGRPAGRPYVARLYVHGALSDGQPVPHVDGHLRGVDPAVGP